MKKYSFIVFLILFFILILLYGYSVKAAPKYWYQGRILSPRFGGPLASLRNSILPKIVADGVGPALYDRSGKYVCAPWGGIAGNGDSLERCPDFAVNSYIVGETPEIIASAKRQNYYCSQITQKFNIPAELSVAEISEKKAKDIANKTFISIYGEENIKKQYPLSATSCDKVWIISGIMQEMRLGGVAQAVINKKDGEILEITHGK